MCIRDRATHDGLYTGTVSGWIKVSPSIDLMEFAVAADGTYLASGHPGPQAGLPSPAGLIRSTDGGTTWKHLSRGGQSDFHALGAGTGLIAAFDGKLRLSTNGTDWTEAKIPADPYSLAVNTAGDHLIATTGDGTFTSSCLLYTSDAAD